jgi:hypothetical protein
MGRWWFITLPLFVLTITAAAVMSTSIQPEFTARGSMVLNGPSGTGEEVVNPLLSQNGALPTAAYVTSLSVTSPQVIRILEDEGLSSSYDVAAQDRLPIILLETRADDRKIATDTALRLVELIDADLRLRQDAAAVPADQRVSADVISISSVGGADYGGRKRLQIAIFALGLGMTASSAFVAEGARQRRRKRSELGDDDDQGVVPTDDDLDAEGAAAATPENDESAATRPTRQGSGRRQPEREEQVARTGAR